VREGDDVVPGIRLAEVHADHVILEHNGTRETLVWPSKASAATSASRISK
jgi:general secretion pathway protein C